MSQNTKSGIDLAALALAVMAMFAIVVAGTFSGAFACRTDYPVTIGTVVDLGGGCQHSPGQLARMTRNNVAQAPTGAALR